MKYQLVLHIAFLCCLLKACVCDSSARNRQTPTIPWSTYCECLKMDTKDASEIKTCFKNFFKGQAVKQIMRKHRSNREACFRPNKDGDQECKVVRNHRLSLMLRGDLNQVEDVGNSRSILVAIWKRHPDIAEACDATFNPNRQTPTPSIDIAEKIGRFSRLTLNNLKEGDGFVNFITSVIGLAPISNSLRNQVFKICYQDSEQASSGSAVYAAYKKNFCDYEYFEDLAKKMKKFQTEVNDWSASKQSNLFMAIRLNFVVLDEQKSSRFISSELSVEVSSAEKQNGYRDTINAIIQIIETKDIDQLKVLTYFLPSSILICASSENESTEACYFKKILDQLVTHFKISGIRINGKKRMKLNTGTNYEKLLEFRLLNRILTVVQNNQLTTIDLAQDIKDNSNARFGELRSYFVELQSFNENKAQADISFINGWIAEYRRTLSNINGRGLIETNGRGLGLLLGLFITGTTFNVAEHALRFGVAIAESFNPLKSLFGGTTLSDILDATAAFATALTGIASAVNLQAQVQTLQDKAKDLASRFDSNDVSIKKVLELIEDVDDSTAAQFEQLRKDFIVSYTAYSPEVKRPELEAIEEHWIGVVTEACNGIDGLDSASSAPAVTAVKAEGLCWRLPMTIKEMMATYMEIYDFQFDLMETLAQAMRAKIGKRAANQIATDLNTFPERETDDQFKYKSVYTLSYLTYQVQTWNVIENYCDKLEYAEGGQRPRECQGEKTDLSVILSRTKRTCTGDNEAKVRIPIRTTGDDDAATLNITNLYRGREDSFHITSKQWLIDNKWIKQSQANKAMYIKSFELFLPTVSTDEPVGYISKTFATGENVLDSCSECTQYILPNQAIESNFVEGKDAECSESKKIPNPYNICSTKKLPKICRQTTRLEPPAGALYPSVFARWRFTVDGYQDTPIPEPGNEDMYIQAKITFCLLGGGSTFRSKRSSSSRKCCEGNNYFSVEANKCIACPAGAPNLKGYYCEKNQDAMMA